MFIIMIVSYIIVTTLDTYKIFKNREYGKLAVYYSLTIVSMIIGAIIGMDIDVPSPADPIKQVVKSFVGK